MKRRFTRFMTLTICENVIMQIMQTWFDFHQDTIDTAIDQRCNRLRLCVRTSGGYFEHMLWNECSLCDLTEHFVKLPMQFDARNGYFVVSIKRRSCVHMHWFFFKISALYKSFTYLLTYLLTFGVSTCTKYCRVVTVLQIVAHLQFFDICSLTIL